MSFNGNVVNVLIASPGDTGELRDLVERAIHGWNTDRARQCKIVLLPLRWETGAVSELGEAGQAVINRQLVDEADIIIGLFDAKLGTPTALFLSGTAEELDRGLAHGARVHVYFSDMPIPRNVNTRQLESLNAFRESLGQRGLLGSFSSHYDLATKIRTALEHDISRIIADATEDSNDRRTPIAKASFRVEYQHGPGPANGRIELQNVGTETAENVQLVITAKSEGSAPIQRFDEIEQFYLDPLARRSFPVYQTRGTAATWRVIVAWEEDVRSYSESHMVTAR